MRLSKKILLIIVSIALIFGMSWLIAFGGFHLLNMHFWGVFSLTTALQLILPRIYDAFVEKYFIVKTITEYNSKPYKQYPINTACQHCGNIATLNLDLDDSEYVCGNCHKHNAVHVTFMTAALQTPINTQVL